MIMRNTHFEDVAPLFALVVEWLVQHLHYFNEVVSVCCRYLEGVLPALGSEVNTVGGGVGMIGRAGHVRAAVGVLGHGSGRFKSGKPRRGDADGNIYENENLDRIRRCIQRMEGMPKASVRDTGGNRDQRENLK